MWIEKVGLSSVPNVSRPLRRTINAIHCQLVATSAINASLVEFRHKTSSQEAVTHT